MSDMEPQSLTCASEPEREPTFEVLPGRTSDLGGLSIHRLLPRSRRRLVGPWCFLDAFGPVSFESGKAMDVPPHPHIGLQTVWEAGRRFEEVEGYAGPRMEAPPFPPRGRGR